MLVEDKDQAYQAQWIRWPQTHCVWCLSVSVRLLNSPLSIRINWTFNQMCACVCLSLSLTKKQINQRNAFPNQFTSPPSVFSLVPKCTRAYASVYIPGTSLLHLCAAPPPFIAIFHREPWHCWPTAVFMVALCHSLGRGQRGERMKDACWDHQIFLV